MSGFQWWGDFEIEPGAARRWRIGPTTIHVQRTPNDWKVALLQGEDPFDTQLSIAEPTTEEPDAAATVTRHATSDGGNVLRLLPAHADRPVIVDTETPLYLPPQEETTLYIGVPVWIRILAGRDFVPLIDLPLFRPSDTWFGPNTMTGELCYASRTTARLQFENVVLRPHRAVVAAYIQNRADTHLLLEKLKVPVRHMSMYVSKSGHLCSEGLTLHREDDSEQASVRLDRDPGLPGGGTTFVSSARQVISKGFLVAAFGGLFPRKAVKRHERNPRKPATAGDPDPEAPV